MNKQDIKGNHERSFSLNREQINEEKRTVELAFSSEEPVSRWYGSEILDHDPASINLDRLESGGALLVDHDSRDLVGVVEKVWLDDDRKCRAIVRFGSGARASEIFTDVKDGIRQLVSFGYSVDKYEVTEGKDGASDVYRLTDWTPFEISIVAIPADSSVGVGRSNENVKSKVEKMNKKVKVEKREDDIQAPDLVSVKAEARAEEQTRIRGISALGDKHDLDDLAREFIDGEKSVADFQSAVLDKIGERNVEVRANQEKTHDEALGLSDRETQKFSFVRVMNALANPNSPEAQRAAAFEMEVSAEGADKAGIQSRGVYIPPEVRALSSGGATAGAEFVAENLLAGSYIEGLRNSMAVANAGATILTGLVGNVEIPRQTSAAAAAWIAAEDGDASESDPAFDQVTLAPKDLGAYTEVTRRLLMQSTPAIEQIVRADLMQAGALKIDAAALYGTGATGQPRGVANQTGINTVDFVADAPTYAELISMVKEVMLDNALLGKTGYINDPTGWASGMTTEKASGTAKFLIEDGRVNGYGLNTTNQVAVNDWFFANWADLLIGQWGGSELVVDPYTHSLKGKTRFVMFQTVDAAVRQPGSFCHGDNWA